MKRFLLLAAAIGFSAATAAQDIDSLERQLERARQDAPMVLKPFVLVSGPANAKGMYEPAFEVDLEVLSKGGDSLKKPAFATFRLPGKSRVQDVYLNLTLSLDQAPAGPYTVRFVVRDLNSNKVGRVEQVIAIR